MANVLVTGGAGYIGSVCCAQLLAHGHSVVVVDDLSTGFRDAVPSNAMFERMDIGDRLRMRRLLAETHVDTVFHFAAKALIPESVSNPGVFFEANVASGIALLEELRRARVRKFIFSSTAAVYGNPAVVPILEDHPKDPVNSYGESKLAFERILAWYVRAYGWGVAVMRYFNASGAWNGIGERHDPETHIIPLLLQVAARERDVFQIFGTDYDTPDGTCLRDYVHVLDIVDAHIRAMRILESEGITVMNIGTGKSHSVREILKAAEEVTGTHIATRSADRRPGDPAVLCASPARLKQTLNWTAQHSDLANILASAWQFHKADSQKLIGS